MDRFAILTSRKRAMIALVHTMIFLLIAAVQLRFTHAAALSWHGSNRNAIALLAVYSIVMTVLLMLLQRAVCAVEKLYFALCATSAAFGVVRIVLGDPVLHANWLRVALLAAAAVIGAAILRTHSTGPAEANARCAIVAD